MTSGQLPPKVSKAIMKASRFKAGAGFVMPIRHLSEKTRSTRRTKNDGQGRYTLVWQDAAVAAGGAIAFWLLIVGLAYSTSHQWNWPLAIVLGVAMLPLGFLGGVRHRL
jgi:hypothetical protein